MQIITEKKSLIAQIHIKSDKSQIKYCTNRYAHRRTLDCERNGKKSGIKECQVAKKKKKIK